MADKKLFDGSLVTTPSGAKRVAIGDASTAAQNITLNDLKRWITGTTAPVTVLTKSVNIGAWNMDSTRGKTVSTGVALSKIRDVHVMICSDSGEMFPIGVPSENQNCNPAGWYCVCNTSTSNATVQLVRDDGKKFDASGFNDGTMNRGYVTVHYVL